MKDFNTSEYLPACNSTSAFISRHEEALFKWIVSRKKSLYRSWASFLDSHADFMEDFPQNWYDFSYSTCACTYVFCFPEHLAEFEKSRKQKLEAEDPAYFAMFSECPWFYGFFTVQEKLGDNFFSIVEQFSGKTYVLYSASVTRLLKNKAQSFFALLLDNQKCLQTYGIVCGFAGIMADDVINLGTALEKQPSSKEIIGDSIAKNPMPFLLLYKFSNIPPSIHGNDKIEFCESSIPTPESVSEGIPAQLAEHHSETRKNVTKLHLGANDFFESADLFIDRDEHKAVLTARCLRVYQQWQNNIVQYFPFPVAPSTRMSALSLLVCKDIAGFEYPFDKYETLFSQPSVKEDAALQRLNNALGELVMEYNNGGQYDIEKIGKKYKLSETEIQQLGSIAAKMALDDNPGLPYAIPGYIPPPPSGREVLAGFLSDNSLFDFNFSPKVSQLFEENWNNMEHVVAEYSSSKHTARDLTEFPDIIEETYTNFWDSDDQTILMYTIYLLHSNGDIFHEARMYACEVLRTFHQILLPELTEETISAFIRRYSRYLFIILRPFGLIETDRTYELKDIRLGTFKLRKTNFFDEWLLF